MSNRRILNIVWVCTGLSSLLRSSALADMSPDWVAELPVGSSITAGSYGAVVDAEGNTYVTGSTGTSSNRDIKTAKFAPDGSLLWSMDYDGPVQWHEGVAGIALGPDGSVYVAGSTPASNFFANVLLLKYDGQTGDLLWDEQFDGGLYISDGATCVTTDALGNIYVGGHTVGDGSDSLTIKFDSDGNIIWSETWDGPAGAPYSQEAARGIAVAPDGNVVVIIDGVMNSLHPDYVTIKYAASDGEALWQNNWGSNGGDFPNDLVIDDAGDVYVTGTSINGNDMYATIKIDGGDGALIWDEYDSNGIDDGARAVALDGQGGVYVTGSVDPDGDHSNFNDNIYTVKRDAADGDQLWTHLYGANCIGCYDVPADMIVDPAGHAFVVGYTSSPPYGADTILLVLDAGSGEETDRGIVSGEADESSEAHVLRFDAQHNVFIGGDFSSFDTGEVDMSVVKFASMAAVPGDIDGDGDLDTADLDLFVNVLLGNDTDPAHVAAADLNDDGAADGLDAQPFVDLLIGD